MLRCRLVGWRRPLALGLVMALGLMTKLSLVIFMVVPGSVLLLWWRRGERWELGLLLGCVAFCLGAFVVVVDRWSRYILPIYPLCAVLCGLALAQILGRLPRRPGRAAAVALTLVLLTVIPALTLVEPDAGEVREARSGLLSPDRRPHRGYGEAARALLAFGPEVMLIYGSMPALNRNIGQDLVWYFRGFRFKNLEIADAERRLARGESVSVLLVNFSPPADTRAPHPGPVETWPVPPPGMESLGAGARWFTRHPRRQRLVASADPDGVEYSAFRLHL